MARVNVYLPDELAARVKAAKLSVSRITQQALEEALDHRLVDRWLDEVAALPPVEIDPEVIAAAISAAKDEVEGIA